MVNRDTSAVGATAPDAESKADNTAGDAPAGSVAGGGTADATPPTRDPEVERLASIYLDPARHPVLSGVERPFFDHWIINVVSEEDPHLQRWVDREETAVARARDSVRALDARHPVAGADVLDIGCQNGAKLVALAQAGAVPHGIDVVAEAVVAAGFRGDSYELDLDARVGDACNLDFPDESMDIVCSNDVYEHVPDKMAMLDENIRVLRPGGLLAIIAPQRFSLKHLLSDPHYGHPGLSILPGSAAGWVNRKVYHEAVYEVETLPTRTRTAMEMKRRGIRLLSEPEPGIRGVARRGVDELRQVFQLFGIKE